MKPTQNIIHSSAFNIEYGNKASALKGNALIESIFNSQILPEIEVAISNKIPDGVLIELSKLEINIGTINEKDLFDNLARKIRVQLEKALDFKLDVGKEIKEGDQTLNGQKSGNFLVTSIEIFLLKGYFPYAVKQELSFDELVTAAIQTHKKEFTDIVIKHRNQESAIRRIISNLKQQTFSEIIFALEPVNAEWIIGFGKIISQMKKELNLNHYNETEFIQLINYSILKYVLNDTSSNFSKKRFAMEILSEFGNIFQPHSQLLISKAQNNAGKTATSELIEETLGKLWDKQKSNAHENSDKEIPLEQLVKILNAGKVNFSVFDANFLKKELIRAVQDREKRDVLIKKLNEPGANLILELFGKDNTQKLHKQIAAFTEKVAGKPDKTSTFNNLVLQTTLYLQENAIRKLETEEFILFLIYSAGLDQTKTLTGSVFSDFIQTQENVSHAEISAVIKEEEKFQEISKICNVLSKNQEQPIIYKGQKLQNSSVAEEYFTIYKRKIISYFLDSGFLPTAFKNLSKSDVQQIFVDFLREKDDFLAVQLKENKNSQLLVTALNKLMTNDLHDVLHEYLIHFFRIEYSNLTETIAEISQQFSFKSNRIHAQSFLNEIFIRALAESKSGNSVAVFTLFVHENLYAELKKDSTEPNKLFQLLLSKSVNALEIKTSQKHYEPDHESNFNLKNATDQGYSLLFNLLQLRQLKLNDEIPEKLKILLVQIKSDEKLFEKFFSNSIKNQIPSEAAFENEKIKTYIKQLEELIEVWQTSKEVGSTKSYKNEAKTDITQELDFYISVLTFYAQKGFFPWWAAPISISNLIYELKKQSRLLPQSFEKVMIQTEKQEHIFERLIQKLLTNSLKDLNTIFINYGVLKSTWEKSLQKNENRDSTSKSRENNATNLSKSSGLDIDEFIKEAHNDDDLLNKGLYFFTDDNILNRWLGKSPQVAAQIREYLSITPYFYYRNVTPPQWRQAVFGFSLEYYREENKKQSAQYHNKFLNYLKKRYSNVNWTEVLTSVYRLVQSSRNVVNVTFPATLFQLLNIESTIRLPKHNNDNVENNEITPDDTGIETKINNAGLVLLWPFLTRLFEHLSLVKQGAFVNQESMNRAVYILQYLVYNETNFPEYELVLNKLLVGMQPNMHFEPFVTLTDEEKNMTKSLLNGFISNWGKVKNSTPEGVQETFLQRQGMLKFKEESVLLSVEKKGVDVLLDSIPWNFSLITLSWMRKPIHVEWR